MPDNYFIDSNIFLYAFSTADDEKRILAKEIVASDGCISYQVINEVSVNLLKKFKLNEEDIFKFIVSSYDRYTVIEMTKELFLSASNLRKKYNFSYYDSLIVSAALVGQCAELYTEDMQHNQLVENKLRIINPFK